MNLYEMKRWLLRIAVRQHIRQGRPDLYNDMLDEIVSVHREVFTEDNRPSTRNFMHEMIDLAIWRSYNA